MIALLSFVRRLCGRRGVTVTGEAARSGVDKKTIRRWLAAIKQAGWRVTSRAEAYGARRYWGRIGK